MVRNASGSHVTSAGSMPTLLSVRGTRYCVAMASFSWSRYPVSRMISMRSRNGSGMPDSEFAVVTNST